MDGQKLDSEMIQLLNQIPIEEKPSGIDETLTSLQENVNFIRDQIEKKPKKLSLKKLDEKLIMILKILKKNGFNCDV